MAYYELQRWDIGEQIRQLLVENPSLRKDPELQEAFLRISLNRNATQGRQSFIMLLGYTCCRSHAAKLISQLDDEGVVGHVISTITKMRTRDFMEQIRPFQEHKRTWIRNEAKRYCNRNVDRGA